jgi:predicted YcjX-like family ATPase
MAPQRWTEEQEIALVSAWKHVEESPHQTNKWYRILHEYNRLVGGSDRTIESLSRKLTDLNTKCQIFNGYHNRTLEVVPSDMPEDAAIRYTKKQYQSKEHKEFKHVSAWQMMRDRLNA